MFVLGEVFGHPYTEIAAIVDRTPAAIRQLAHRAREHVQARRPRFPADPRVRKQVTERFLAALLGGDLNGFLELLAPEVTVWTDGGGKARMAGLRGVHARDKVARMLAAGSFHPHPASTSCTAASTATHPRAWTTPLNPSVYPVVLRGLRNGGSPGPRHRETVLGLPAGSLIDPAGRVVALRYGRHANDQWTVDELIELASPWAVPEPSHTA